MTSNAQDIFFSGDGGERMSTREFADRGILFKTSKTQHLVYKEFGDSTDIQAVKKKNGNLGSGKVIMVLKDPKTGRPGMTSGTKMFSLPIRDFYPGGYVVVGLDVHGKKIFEKMENGSGMLDVTKRGIHTLIFKPLLWRGKQTLSAVYLMKGSIIPIPAIPE